MKLQYAFPNPRKTGLKKSIAKRHKKSKLKSVKAKLRKAVEMAKKHKVSKRAIKKLRKSRDHAAKLMKSKRASPKRRKAARKKHSKLYKRIKKASGRNPLNAYAYKKNQAGKKRLIGKTSTKLKSEIASSLKNDKTIKGLHAKAEKMRKAGRYEEAKTLAARALRLKEVKKKNMLADRKAFAADVKAYKADGAEVHFTKTKESGVAKKRKKKKGGKKKSSRRKKRSGKKASAHKKVSRKKAKRSGRKKSSSRRRKGSKRKSSRRRRRSRMVTHTHAKSTRHVRRGSKARIKSRKRKGSYKVKAHFGRGKKSVRMSGRLREKRGILSGVFKINPFRRNPVTYKSGRSGLEKFLGHDGAEVATMAAAAAAAPYVTKFMTQNVLPYVQNYIPAQAIPHVVNAMPLIVGVGLNALADSKVGQNLGAGRAYAQKLGDGLVAVGLISSVYAFASRMAGGVAGINFTPTMGIMPHGMHGIEYFPRRGMGVMPQLNGVVNRGDFGDVGDYGGAVGYKQSRADFGSDSSLDSQYDTEAGEGDMHTTAMN